MSTALIPLRRRDGSIAAHAIIDSGDAEWARQWKWYLQSHGYVFRGQWIDGRVQMFKLHRELLGLGPEDAAEVDHINGDPLDNRRVNLRAVPKAGNRQNKRSYAGSTSRHRGVSWSRKARRWEATTRLDGKRHWLGYFDDEDEAARAAAAWRETHMPYAVAGR